MLEIKFGIAAASVWLAVAAFGCSANSASEIAKTNAAAPTAAANNNSTAAANQVAPLAANNAPPASAANNSGASALAQNNSKTDKKIVAPAAQIGSGGNDLTLFTQARNALGTDQELSRAVIIEIKEGAATLTGTVSSQAQKVKAAQLIQAVKGIKSVKNDLRISS